MKFFVATSKRVLTFVQHGLLGRHVKSLIVAALLFGCFLGLFKLGVPLIYLTFITVLFSVPVILFLAWRIKTWQKKTLIPVEKPLSRSVATLDCSDGGLVVLDLLALRSWSGTKPPQYDTKELVDPTLRGSLNAARDLQVVASDASSYPLLNLGSLPYLYDIPAHEINEIVEEVKLKAKEVNLEVDVEIEKFRTSHFVRAERATTAPGGMGADFPVETLPVRVLPAEQVDIEISEEGTIISLLTSDQEAVSAEICTEISTPSGIVMLANYKTLKHWSSLTSRDNLADLVVSGPSAKVAGALFHGKFSEDNTASWTDLTLSAAKNLAAKVDSWALTEGRIITWDVRPHSDEFFLLHQLELDGTGTLSLPDGDVVGILIDAPSLRIIVLKDSEGSPVSFRLLPGPV